MTGFERFEVLTALFPFVDVPVRKPRPVLVMSTGAFNTLHGHVIVAMITTGAESQWPSDSVILDLAAAGLKHRSVIRWKVFTLPISAIGRRIGTLAHGDRLAFEAACRTTLSGGAG
ncbi:type II toxin-antitoxin system PemK/MazF family toxin [Methylobacterium sp. BTF04]|uniref:type II toxin-antitoxin system PemK/MazF family toxin n=1 Tax=Methylobacterium sp. BTF04 TaxID=2708300 RepID=UPI0013D7DC7A|nr:type II toxin-antitoxin system PemK/MazF family toxin [Methylobacterium sp. BTF04]NEU13947.1 type II toxin-antitoxin system PemK/MazF family toxin [Methylobacterium sp. BTF04]